MMMMMMIDPVVNL